MLPSIIPVKKIFPVIVFLFFNSACEQSAPVETPPAQTLTRDANGYYCLMTVLNHSGPKGQIILDNATGPLWFTSVRDTLAFTRSPEEPKNIAVIYVNDMSHAEWKNPGEDNWMKASEAWYVIGSNRSGGMGAPEAVPFSSSAAAKTFIQEHGGNLYDYRSIPAEFFSKKTP